MAFALRRTRILHLSRRAAPCPALSLPLHLRTNLARSLHSTRPLCDASSTEIDSADSDKGNRNPASTLARAEHAVVSAFDLFSIGVGPSSSHTVGPMRAGRVFVHDLREMGILDKVRTLKVGLYGSLSATGKGHMTPQAVMMGLEGSDPETIEPSTIGSRYSAIITEKRLQLGGTNTIKYDMDRDMLWRNEPLPTHPNGMRFTVFDDKGDMLATNEYFSVGGGFIVNERTQVDENLYYRAVNKDAASQARREQTHGVDSSDAPSLPAPSSSTAEDPSSPPPGDSLPQPPYLFTNAQGLLNMTRQQNLTIAQLVWQNERSYMSSEQISEGLLRLWSVMDGSIRDGVSSTEELLPGRLGVRRRAAGLYRRLFKGFYPSITPASTNPALSPGSPSSSSTPSLPSGQQAGALTMADGFSAAPPPEAYVNGGLKKTRGRAPLVIGDFEHELSPIPWKTNVFPGIDFLSCYAIAVNEVNASGGRVVTAPTNGAAGVIPAVLKYFVEFISDDVERDVKTFLLTSAAIGMLFKRGATISAAEGGCMAEVGVASAMAAGAFTAVMGGSPAQILQAAEIGIEHHLGLTCDPPSGLVQIPCIERNSLGAVKAVTAAQLALAGDGIHSVTLDEAIEAMRITARDMHNHYKETSLSGLATSMRIPVSSPAC